MKLVSKVLCSLVAAGFACAAAAEEFPNKPVTLLVGFASGGSSDIQARLLADLAGRELKQRIIVENKPGMTAGVMLNYLVRQKPDGYTIASTPASAFITNPFTLKADYSYKDVTYVSAFGRLLQGVSVRSDARWKSFDELVADAKKNPGKIRYASYAPNSTTHYLMRLIATDRGLDWTHVPYNSDGAAAQAMMGGHVDAIASAAGQVPFVSSGQFRLLAVFNKERFALFPNVPTLGELGYNVPNLSHMTTLTGIVAPKGLPADRLKTLAAALEKAYRDPAFIKLMRDLASPIDVLDSAAYEREIAESYRIAEKVYPALVKETPPAAK